VVIVCAAAQKALLKIGIKKVVNRTHGTKWSFVSFAAVSIPLIRKLDVSFAGADVWA
jgi:hypothetical protein